MKEGEMGRHVTCRGTYLYGRRSLWKKKVALGKPILRWNKVR